MSSRVLPVSPPSLPMQSCFPVGTIVYLGFAHGQVYVHLQMGKTETRGSKGKTGITGMAQPLDHPDHHLCQQTGVRGSQGGSPGPAKLRVPGDTCSARNQHTGTSISITWLHTDCYEKKKDDK